MKTNLLPMSAFLGMFFLQINLQSENRPPIIEQTAFTLTGKGISLKNIGDTQFGSTLLACAKIRVSGNVALRVPKTGSIVFQLFKDGKPFGELLPEPARASTAKDTGQYYKFDGDKGRFIEAQTPFYVRKGAKGVFEVRIVEIHYHVNNKNYTYKPQGEEFRTKIEMK